MPREHDPGRHQLSCPGRLGPGAEGGSSPANHRGGFGPVQPGPAVCGLQRGQGLHSPAAPRPCCRAEVPTHGAPGWGKAEVLQTLAKALGLLLAPLWGNEWIPGVCLVGTGCCLASSCHQSESSCTGSLCRRFPARQERLQVLYIRIVSPFPEMEQFIQATVQR